MDAGARLLAGRDYDYMSMAAVAKEADCSVGALYHRYEDKELYLYHLIAGQFHSLTREAELILDAARWPKASISYLTRQIVDFIVTYTTNARAAGAIRATIKLATHQHAVSELFQNFRNVVTERATALLAPHLDSKEATAVGYAIQIVFATVTDALLQKDARPLRSGSARMTDTLTDMVLGYLRYVGKGGQPKHDPADEFAAEDIDEFGAGNEFEYGTISTSDPDLRVSRRSKIAVKAERAKSLATNPKNTVQIPEVVAKPIGKRAHFKMI